MIKIEEDARNSTVYLKFKEFNNLTNKAIRMAYYNIGKDLVSEAKKLINEKPKHGRVYLKRIGVGRRQLKRPQKYIASAPGEAPAVVTGTLRKAIDFTVNGITDMEFGVEPARMFEGGAKVDYSQFLEYKNLIAKTGWGSKHIAPRPFISQAYENKKRNIEQHILESLKKYI